MKNGICSGRILAAFVLIPLDKVLNQKSNFNINKKFKLQTNILKNKFI
jgi:hypothetical protein